MAAPHNDMTRLRRLDPEAARTRATEALRRHGGHVARAAADLVISREALYRWIRIDAALEAARLAAELAAVQRPPRPHPQGRRAPTIAEIDAALARAASELGISPRTLRARIRAGR